jgi:hypothetical protein
MLSMPSAMNSWNVLLSLLATQISLCYKYLSIYLITRKKVMAGLFDDAGSPGVAATAPVTNTIPQPVAPAPVQPPVINTPVAPPAITTNTNTVTDNTGTVINRDITINRNDPNTALLEPTWMNQWKEVLAYVFSSVIAFDFVVAPIMVMVFNTFFHTTMVPWSPLTLGSGGLFYVAMAAILSVGAYGSMVKSRELIKNLPDMGGGDRR